MEEQTLVLLMWVALGVAVVSLMFCFGLAARVRRLEDRVGALGGVGGFAGHGVVPSEGFAAPGSAAPGSPARASATSGPATLGSATPGSVAPGSALVVGPRVHQLVAAGNRIAAIKALRDDNPGLSLADAKRYVDTL